MAINSCDPCACIPPNINQGFYNQTSLVILCGILEAVQGGTGGGDVNLIEVGGSPIALGQGLMAASLPVTIASNQTWTGASNLGKAEDTAFADGDTGIALLGVRRDTAASSTSTNGDYGTVNLDSSGCLYAQARGPVAHGQTAVDNPLINGAVARTSNPGGFTNGLAVTHTTDLIGRQVVALHGLPETTFTAVSAADIVNTSSTQVAAAVASTRRYISAISVSNMSATVNTRVDILDGSTVVWTGPASANGGGYSITFPQQIRCSVNTAINAQCGTTGAEVRVAIAGTNSAQ